MFQVGNNIKFKKFTGIIIRIVYNLGEPTKPEIYKIKWDDGKESSVGADSKRLKLAKGK